MSPSPLNRKALASVVLVALSLSGTQAFTRTTDLAAPKRPSTMCLRAQNNEESFQVQTWNPLRLLVLRLGLTEPAMTSPLNYGKYDGEFECAYCGQVLFDSNAKYDSGSGWPSFWRSAQEDAVQYKMEFDGRLECRCGKCSRYVQMPNCR